MAKVRGDFSCSFFLIEEFFEVRGGANAFLSQIII